MKNIVKNSFLYIAFVAIVAWGCSEETGPTSKISEFEPFSASLSSSTPVVTAQEYDGEQTFTFTFSFDEKQITGVSIDITAGASSTATEGVDFDILTTHVDLDAFEGMKGFDVEVVVYPDFEQEEDETIYLNFSTSIPSGLNGEVLVLNIPDWPADAEYDLSSISGTALSGIDISLDGQDPYESEIVITKTGSDFTITGLGVGWMTDFWGEEILTMEDVAIEIDENDYVIQFNISSDEYMTTLYDGSETTYKIQGTATLIKYTKAMVIEYALISTRNWATWTHDNGYMSDETFTAVLQLP